ncbi:MazG-like family protein [Paenibacillus sp. CMAA1739]|uniref:MazG-like family protein n=1 Tax=Paenibacillus ottowii TaxID=2315729 RepID=UPI002731E76A|nr:MULTISPECIES: MazG-like family protein [Paenibacillus]MDP1511067.1 MazG-like family protein [Paenibacillus ottowii]MEC4566435.1 MazG-like family protein [Paenibacillus sp. CMAA1739]
MDQILKKIQYLSTQEKKTLEQMVLKLSEEVGETSQAMLSYMNANGSEYKQLNISDVREECADVILVALSLFYKLSSDEEELQQFLSKKVDKWESVMT